MIKIKYNIMKLKQLNIIGIALLFMLSTFITSCETWIDPELNEDPNNPVEVGMELVLPSIMVNMAYDQGGNDAVRTVGIWMQQFDGVDRQSYAEATYIYTPADCNNLWNGVYPNMRDILDVMNQASVLNEEGVMYSPQTKGLAEVLMAEHLAFATNLWGDIPYSEALKGDDNLNPKLDTQESIFAEIFSLLDQAIIDLQDETGITGIDGTGDIIFGGDADAWLATAYGLKARYTLMLLERNGTSVYTEAIALVDQALAAGAGTAFEKSNGFRADIFIEATSGNNPIYQFMDQRSGDLVMCKTFMDYLFANADPRIWAVGNGDGNGKGSAPTSQTTEDVDLPGDYVAAETSAVPFLNLSELYFIKAESYLMLGNADADTTFEMAIMQSLAEMADAGDYDLANLYDGDEDDGDIIVTAGDYAEGMAPVSTAADLEYLITQKWIATFGTVQAFNDWRRTGYPTLIPGAKATNSEIPRRYPYSQEEVTYNSNVPGDASIFDQIWWDAVK